ncbi:MAG: hypothetical protein P4L92_01355 [Rudaea sp.]|nr:hypothetical protein [Rudaea sp.]
MNTAIFNFGNVIVPRTNPATPGYVLATHVHARVLGRHIPVPGISHGPGGHLA